MSIFEGVDDISLQKTRVATCLPFGLHSVDNHQPVLLHEMREKVICFQALFSGPYAHGFKGMESLNKYLSVWDKDI